MNKAFGYVRVSTESQAAEGVSMEAQRSRIEQWCHANGYELAGVFVDAGLSGKRADNRPELNNALNAVCKAKAALVVYSLSRLSRSTRDTINISERLDRAGADLVSLSEKIDTTSACGRMIFRLLATFSEFEREVISERTTTAMQHKKSKSERVGEIPFGKVLSDDGVHLVDDAAEMSIIDTIREMRNDGKTIRAITSELNDRGIRTKKGKSWVSSTVGDLVKRIGV